MKLLFKTKTEKVLHRNQIDIEIIVHENIINLNQEFIDFLSSYNSDIDVEDISKFNSKEDFIISNLIYSYWKSVLKNIPKVKLDNRFKIGKYKLPNFESSKYNFSSDNLYLTIRSSERYKKQLIEITK